LKGGQINLDLLELQADFLAGMWAHYEEGLVYLETGDFDQGDTFNADI